MLKALNNVVLYCRDPEAARAWYERVGFTHVRSLHGMHWFALGSVELMLHPSEAGPSGAIPQLYATVSDVGAFFHDVVERGLTPVHHQAEGPLTAPVTTPWGTRELELFDPEGHRWGFVEG